VQAVYHEIALLLAVAAVVGIVTLRLRQPLLVAYIVVGIGLGPSALGWVTAHDQVDLLAQIGVTVLLFVVGLKLDMHVVKSVGPVALATGIGQIVFTTVIGFALALVLGMDALTALYVAVALTFSSTIIIVKLLSDKRELDSLHGRIAVGFLIVQDIAVVVALLLLGSWQSGAGGTDLWRLGVEVALKLAAALVTVTVLMRYVLPRLLDTLARSQELLLLFALAWGTALAAGGDVLGFSKEVGAFLAGFSLASTTYREAIAARLTALRDFLLLFFFIDLGAKLDLGLLGAQVGDALVLSLFVLVGNPLIVMAIMGFMGYRKRTGFLAGLTVAQISEFSIVFMAMGVTLGHTGPTSLGLVTLVGLVTITLSTYMILYSQPLYEWLAPWLQRFERRRPAREMAMERHRPDAAPPDVIVFGAGRFGWGLIEQLRERGIDTLAVDFDPEVVRSLRRARWPVRFGDAEDAEFPATLPLSAVAWVVSTLPEASVNLALPNALRAHGFTGTVALALRGETDAAVFTARGFDHVFRPYEDAAGFAAREIGKSLAREVGTAPAPLPAQQEIPP
jgi:Kef-type K+ transport system membrane component KefB